MNFDFCLNNHRFDIPAKTLYIRDLEKGIVDGIGKEVYNYHLKCWNNLKESDWDGFSYGNKTKNGIDDFILSFKKIIEYIKNDEFNWDISPIAVDDRGILVNGSHRASACLFFNKKYKTKLGKGVYFPFNSFKSYRNLNKVPPNKKYDKLIAYEFCRLKNFNNIDILKNYNKTDYFYSQNGYFIVPVNYTPPKLTEKINLFFEEIKNVI